MAYLFSSMVPAGSSWEGMRRPVPGQKVVPRSWVAPQCSQGAITLIVVESQPPDKKQGIRPWSLDAGLCWRKATDRHIRFGVDVRPGQAENAVMDLLEAAEALNRALAKLTFASPVTHTYNPLVYAGETHAAYCERYGQGPKEVVFLGMNPGPWGMAQTGVPFGDPAMVRWMGIEGEVKRPAREHPKRPVLGLKSGRSEVSGTRLWGAVRDHFGAADRFFKRFYVANYCPLCFMEESGRNRTPDKLPTAERNPLFAACDEHLRRVVETLGPRQVVGIGAFAAKRARAALAGAEVAVGQVLHPSPASPAANKDWVGKVRAELLALKICGQ